MAELVDITAGELGTEHVGFELLLDTVWGEQPATITAVQQDGRYAHLTVTLKPYADRGPVPMMVHRRPDLAMRLIVEAAGG